MSTGSAAPPQLAAAVHSPCIGVCRLDEETGYCLGCGRTGSEIAEWASTDSERKAAIWQSLPARLETLGTKLRLMPWSPADVGAWVARQLTESTGTWVVGVSGALAEFPCGPDVALDRADPPTRITAHRPDGAFRIELHEKLRALSFGADPDRSIVVLALPRSRLSLPVTAALTPLGADVSAVDAAHRAMPLFDIGLERKECRFCVRSGHLELTARLSAASGRHWQAAFGEIGSLLFDATPHRVVETTLARIEVYAPIPRPGERSPEGAHTHLLLQLMNADAEALGGVALPQWAAPAAVYYPRRDLAVGECAKGVG